MPVLGPPVVSQWYQHRDKGYQFHVVAVDGDDGTVEMQHFDGDLEEIEIDVWYQMDLEAIEAPGDWTGPIDDIEWDDLDYSETDMLPADWTGALEERAPGEEEEQ